MDKTDTPSTTNMTFNENQRDFLRLLGYLFLCCEKYQKAVTTFELLHLIEPEDIDVMLSLAFALLNNQQYDKAHDVSALLSRNTTDAEKLKMTEIIRAKALWGAGHREEAEAIMKNIIFAG